MIVPDYYKILGISTDATSDEIKKAYKEKARKYHPDVSKDEHSLEIFQLLNLAYHTLIDPALRKKYDLLLKYPDSSVVTKVDPRWRHPADANYYKRRQQNIKIKPQPILKKSLQRLNTFIFYSIVGVLSFGIVLGFIDLFTDFDFRGLLLSIFIMSLLIIGVRIIRREKRNHKSD